ncbi:MAG: hypothetical protein HC906_04385 [Bacteroidales bacterium]|nr:hypothetical protein [Bacteroidales bacterium]
MKILILSYHLSSAGGAEVVAWELARHLAINSEKEVFFFCFGIKNRSFVQENIHITEFKEYKRNHIYYLFLVSGKY